MTFEANFFKKKGIDLYVFEFLLFITALSIPFSYAFNSICIGLLFVYSFHWCQKKNYSGLISKKNYLPILFVCFFMVLVGGIFYSANMEGGLSYVTRNIVFLLLPITFLNLKPVLNHRRIRMALFGLFFGTIIILFGIHFNIVFKIIDKHLGFDTLLKHFVRVRFVQEGIVEIHPPYFGIFTVFSMVFISQQKLVVDQTWNMLLKTLVLLYLLLSLYGISSFMAILLLAMAIGFYCIGQWRKGRKKTMVIMMMLLVLGVIAVSRLNFKVMENGYTGSTLLGRVEWSFFRGKGDTSRPENWESVVMVIKNNFFLGVGSDGGLDILQAHRNPKSESFRNDHNAHNQYLETFLRHGIFGFLIFLMILFALTVEAAKSKDILFCTFIVFCMVSFLTESYLVRQWGSTFFVFFACMFSEAYKT